MVPRNSESNRGFGLVVPRLGALKRFATDREASLWKKLLLVVVLFYIAFPADLVPDLIPIWGWLDDLGAAGIGTLFLSWVLKPYSTLDTSGVEASQLEPKDE